MDFQVEVIWVAVKLPNHRHRTLKVPTEGLNIEAMCIMSLLGSAVTFLSCCGQGIYAPFASGECKGDFLGQGFSAMIYPSVVGI